MDDGPALSRLGFGLLRVKRTAVSRWRSGVILGASLALAAGCSGSHHRSAPADTTSSSAAVSVPAQAMTTSTISSRPVASAPASAPPGGPVPQGFRAASVTFITSEEGWLLGVAPCTSAPCTSVLRTTDGGAHWVGIPAPRDELARSANPEPGASGIEAIRFATATVGFAFDPDFYVTTNGGQTWARDQTLAGQKVAVVAVAATPDGTYAVTQPASSTGTPGPLTVVRAAPGSVTFTALASLPAGNVRPSALVGAGSDAYLAYTPTSDSPSHTATVLYQITGTKVVKTTVPTNSEPCSVGASSAAAAVLVCGQGVGGGSMGARTIYGTTDSGTSWTTLPDPGHVDCSYDTDGVAVTANGHTVIASVNAAESCLTATGNYGSSWTTALTVVNQGQGWADLGFENNNTGVVILGPAVEGTVGSASDIGRLYRTTDGGLQWSSVAIS